MLVTYREYVLLWMSCEINEANWKRYEHLARLEVAHATFDRVNDLNPVPESVKECICDVADRLYHRDQMMHQYGAAVSSVSNDGVSINYEGDGTMTETGFRDELTGVIKKHLVNTGLLFRGVY